MTDGKNTSVPGTALPFVPDLAESNEAFEAFLCYFDIGKNRRLRQVAEKTNTHPSTVKRWAARHKWRERIQAYNEGLFRTRFEVEEELQRSQAEKWAERAAEWKEVEWVSAKKLVEAARVHLEAMEALEPGKISLLEVARALEIASKLARLATDLATERQEHTGAKGGAIQVEISSALDKIYGSAMKRASVVEAAAIPEQKV